MILRLWMALITSQHFIGMPSDIAAMTSLENRSRSIAKPNGFQKNIRILVEMFANPIIRARFGQTQSVVNTSHIIALPWVHIFVD